MASQRRGPLSLARDLPRDYFPTAFVTRCCFAGIQIGLIRLPVTITGVRLRLRGMFAGLVFVRSPIELRDAVLVTRRNFFDKPVAFRSV